MPRIKTVTIPQEILEWLEKRASEQELTLNAYASLIVQAYAKKQEKSLKIVIPQRGGKREGAGNPNWIKKDQS